MGYVLILRVGILLEDPGLRWPPTYEKCQHFLFNNKYYWYKFATVT